MSKTTVHPKPPQVFMLEDITVELGDCAYPGRWFIPLLRLGGPKELFARLQGLAYLLDLHRDLTEDAMDFIRGCVRDIADKVYVPDDDQPPRAADCRVVVCGQQAVA